MRHSNFTVRMFIGVLILYYPFSFTGCYFNANLLNRTIKCKKLNYVKKAKLSGHSFELDIFNIAIFF